MVGDVSFAREATARYQRRQRQAAIPSERTLAGRARAKARKSGALTYKGTRAPKDIAYGLLAPLAASNGRNRTAPRCRPPCGQKSANSRKPITSGSRERCELRNWACNFERRGSMSLAVVRDITPARNRRRQNIGEVAWTCVGGTSMPPRTGSPNCWSSLLTRIGPWRSKPENSLSGTFSAMNAAAATPSRTERQGTRPAPGRGEGSRACDCRAGKSPSWTWSSPL